MLALLLEEQPNIPRDSLEHLIATQFSGVNFAAFPDMDSFKAAMSPEYSAGFRVLALLGLLLSSNATGDQITAMLKEAFAIPGARDLPEFVEAGSRLRQFKLLRPEAASLVGGPQHV